MEAYTFCHLNVKTFTKRQNDKLESKQKQIRARSKVIPQNKQKELKKINKKNSRAKLEKIRSAKLAQACTDFTNKLNNPIFLSFTDSFEKKHPKEFFQEIGFITKEMY